MFPIYCFHPTVRKQIMVTGRGLSKRNPFAKAKSAHSQKLTGIYICMCVAIDLCGATFNLYIIQTKTTHDISFIDWQGFQWKRIEREVEESWNSCDVQWTISISAKLCETQLKPLLRERQHAVKAKLGEKKNTNQVLFGQRYKLNLHVKPVYIKEN